MKEFTIGTNESGQRLDKYLGKLLSGASMSFIFKMLRKKNFTLNGKKAAGNEILAMGDRVKLFLSDETFDKFSSKAPETASEFMRASKLGLAVLYEDEDIVVFNKPAGLLSQRAEKEDVSVNDYLLYYLLSEKKISAAELKTFRPSIANRLDRNTSGLILCGKSLAGLQYLSAILKDRSLHKYYRCLVVGKLTDAVTVEGYLVKNSAKNTVSVTKTPGDADKASYIQTGIAPIKSYRFKGKDYTELSIHLITGKTHQIRAHLASIGHPIVGDVKYGLQQTEPLSKALGVKRQLLHAYELWFPIRQSDKIQGLSGKKLTAPLPKDYESVLKELQNGNMEQQRS